MKKDFLAILKTWCTIIGGTLIVFCLLFFGVGFLAKNTGLWFATCIVMSLPLFCFIALIFLKNKF